ncbi:SDR family oxidoreductase [Phenylobacterium sp.]|uniref:SDR family oxidoreductase n=1 Tax=Phenylobacterium sp. TaxID=1871053 RepID=UPI0025DB8FC8|nr:SDR family oxidoreductase [Phenylobacterium sp.]
MRVFVTGATGFIGMAVLRELLGAGHEVVGLARSADGAAAVAALGAEVRRGDLEDVAGLEAAAAQADGVIHLAFNHDFSRYLQNCADDRRVIELFGRVLAGSGRPLLVTSGLLGGAPGRATVESDPAPSSALSPRAASEEAAADATRAGVNVGVVRLPQVHDTRRQGLVTYAIEVARAKGVCAYVGDGANRWAAAHVLDVARLYRLALEAAEPGACYHAVGEEGVAMRDIAETIGRRLDLPVASVAPEAAEGHFGWLAAFAGRDSPASSAWTRERLDWRPTGRGLLADLAALELTHA